jgi:glycerophosphoryl diester phosphodiesterase
MIALPSVIGHRGAAALAPENTLASFRRAAQLGVAMVEFDVRLSGDGEPVVFHDDTLVRTTNGSGRVAEHSLKALKRLDAGSWFAPDFAGEAIPSLAEVLELCRTLGLAVNMEIKPDAGREAETARVAMAGAALLWGDSPPPLVSSFARLSLEVARDEHPGWPRGLLVGRVPADWRQRAATLGCAAIHADQRRLSAAQVAEIRAGGLAVLAYTVNDGNRARKLWAAGVASVFSDSPNFS